MANRRAITPELGILEANLRANAYKQVDFIFGATIRNFIQNGTSTIGVIMKDFEKFVEVYDKELKGSRAKFRDAHQISAEKARSAMLRRYDETNENRPSYRTNPTDARLKRFADGKLRNALASPEMFQISYQSIGFGNTALLDKEAPQWARLNWGAGGVANSGAGFSPGSQGGSGYKSNFSRFFNVGATTLAESPGPRPAFSIPKGFWFDGTKFYPYSRQLSDLAHAGGNPEGGAAQGNIPGSGGLLAHYAGAGRRGKLSSSVAFQKRMETKGIKAHRFLDAGLFELFSSVGNEYQKIVDGWMEKAKAASA